jgi:hypothetical protein
MIHEESTFDAKRLMETTLAFLESRRRLTFHDETLAFRP